MKRNRYSTLKLFNKLSQRAYKISKKKGLGWKWVDAQRFVSANIYPSYKGTTRISKLKVTDVDRLVELKLAQPTPTPLPIPKPKKNCKNPKDYASIFFETFDWFDIVEKLSIFADNMQIDLDLEYNGQVIERTGVIDVAQLPNLMNVREEIRKYVPNSPPERISLDIVVVDGRKDDNQPCSYYVLATFENSNAYFNAQSRFADVSFKSKKDMSEKDLQEVEEKEDEALGKMKLQKLKKDVKKIKRPTKVEAEAPPIADEDKVKLDKLKEYNKAVKELKKLLKEGLITKKQFSKRFDELGKNLKEGGII